MLFRFYYFYAIRTNAVCVEERHEYWICREYLPLILLVFVFLFHTVTCAVENDHRTVLALTLQIDFVTIPTSFMDSVKQWSN